MLVLAVLVGERYNRRSSWLNNNSQFDVLLVFPWENCNLSIKVSSEQLRM